MRKNDEIEIKITGYTSEGAGVGRYDGMAVFTPCTAVGDVCRVRIIKLAKSYAIGKLIAVMAPSADRADSLCPVSQKCGGCAFWHISYEAELKAKLETVQSALSRIGRLDVRVNEIIGAPETVGYRNKASFPVAADENGKAVFGFFARGSHRVVPCKNCLIQSSLSCEIAGAVCDFMNENGILPYDEKSGLGLVRHIFVRTSADNKAHLCLVINAASMPKADKLVQYLTGKIPALCGITLCPNTKNTNIIMGDILIPLWGDKFLRDRLCGSEFEISPHAFYQVNHDQCERLYAKALECAAIAPEDTVFDLYCGIGTMTQLFAAKAKHVYGVEIVPQAVENAAASARKNGFENISFECGDAPTVASRLKSQGIIPDVVVVDPPRAGLGGNLVADIAEMSPKKVVYVSCNPATLARDLALFEKLGYSAISVTAIDMFPRTPHVESVVLLTKELL